MATYFITDAHLGAACAGDPNLHQDKLVQLLQDIANDADAVYFLGDMLDFWFEYHDVVPAGYIHFFAEVAQLTKKGIPVYWLHGNHDMWTGKFLESQLGVTIIPDTFYKICADNAKIILTHGDMIGRVKPSYRFLHTLFHSKLCRRMLAVVHPRITFGIAKRWSARSRKAQRSKNKFDTGPLLLWAEKFLSNNPDNKDIRYIISGHFHTDSILAIPHCQAKLVLVGDTFRRFSYGRLSDGKITIEHFDTQAK